MRAPAAAAVESARTAEESALLAEALLLAGSATVFLGDLGRAEEQLVEAGRLGVTTALPWISVHVTTAQAQLLLRADDPAGAAALLADAERAARELGSPFTLATILNVQASLAQATGEGGEALDRLVEAAHLAAEVATTWTLAYTLPGLAVVAAQRGQPELAAELFAAGSATAEAASVAVAFPPDVEIARHWLPAVRAELGEEAFRRAWERGRGVRPADVPRLAARVTRRSAPS